MPRALLLLPSVLLCFFAGAVLFGETALAAGLLSAAALLLLLLILRLVGRTDPSRRLCRDCRHEKEGRCLRPRAGALDMVTGEVITPPADSCRAHRRKGWLHGRVGWRTETISGHQMVVRYCGREGRWWEPRPELDPKIAALLREQEELRSRIRLHELEEHQSRLRRQEAGP